jgi:hypothetical protein
LEQEKLNQRKTPDYEEGMDPIKEEEEGDALIAKSSKSKVNSQEQFLQKDNSDN